MLTEEIRIGQLGKERLLVLANFLDTLDPKKFDMEGWWETNVHPNCGTAGCAGGWAATIPEFNAAGLTLDVQGEFATPVYNEADDVRKLYGFSALREFFEIETEVLPYDLFDTDYYVDKYNLAGPKAITPLMVAEHIRTCVNSSK